MVKDKTLKLNNRFCPTYLVGQALPMTASSSQPKLASLEQLEDTPRTGHLVQSSAASQVTKEDVRPSGSFSPDPSPSLPCKVESQHLPYPELGFLEPTHTEFTGKWNGKVLGQEHGMCVTNMLPT